MIFRYDADKSIIRRFSWLWFKFYWYKWIRRKPVIGFYEGIPIYKGEVCP